MIKAQLPVDSVFTNSCQTWVNHPSSSYENNLVEIESGSITLGRPQSKDKIVDEEHAKNLVSTYGWDNEFGWHHAKVEKFKVSEKLICNGEFLLFV